MQGLIKQKQELQDLVGKTDMTWEVEKTSREVMRRSHVYVGHRAISHTF